MPRPSLPSVTLLCADCVDAARAESALERCKALCDFGAVKLLTSLPSSSPHLVEIPPLTNICDYSVFMLKRAYEFVDTPHMLIVQHDGWVLNPGAWDPAWLGYDYTAPLFIHPHVINAGSVGSGGFSLRSRALMYFIAQNLPNWDGSAASTDYIMNYTGSYEDGVISILFRRILEASGFKFAPPAQAVRFAQGGNCDPNYHVERPFGFHGMWPNIDHLTGVVAPFPVRNG